MTCSRCPEPASWHLIEPDEFVCHSHFMFHQGDYLAAHPVSEACSRGFFVGDRCVSDLEVTV